MLSHLFLGLSLVGSEWVLYLLILLSILSVTLILERLKFYSDASRGLGEFRQEIRSAAQSNNWNGAILAAAKRTEQASKTSPDLEAEMALAILTEGDSSSPAVVGELAQDAVMRAKLAWERNLSVLATIGANAPFVGLLGTVLGIIKAFHELSQQAGTGAQTVTAGISEALIATAIGIAVAIPAVVSFNLFQRKVKSALAQAEALKSFLVGRRFSGGSG